MSKLLTQEELNQLYMDFFAISGGLKIFSHIDALNESNHRLNDTIKDLAKDRDKFCDELARRDALAGEPVLEIDHTGAYYDYKLLTENLPNGKYILYAVPPAPAAQDEPVAEITIKWALPPALRAQMYYKPGALQLPDGTHNLYVTAPPAPAVEQDVKNILGLLDEHEWAEHCTKTELGQRLECAITELHNFQQAPAVPDETTAHEARMAVGFNRYAQSGYIDGWNACRAAMLAKRRQGAKS